MIEMIWIKLLEKYSYSFEKFENIYTYENDMHENIQSCSSKKLGRRFLYESFDIQKILTHFCMICNISPYFFFNLLHQLISIEKIQALNNILISSIRLGLGLSNFWLGLSMKKTHEKRMEKWRLGTYIRWERRISLLKIT